MYLAKVKRRKQEQEQEQEKGTHAAGSDDEGREEGDDHQASGREGDEEEIDKTVTGYWRPTALLQAMLDAWTTDLEQDSQTVYRTPLPVFQNFAALFDSSNTSPPLPG